MFGKLFKYDFRAIARTELPSLFALLCVTALGCLNAGVLCVSAENNGGFLSLLAAGGFMLTVTAFGGLILVMSLMVYVRFYKSTVTDEAYMTFTLPAKPSRILGAKFLSAFLWTILIGAAYLIAVLLVCLTVLACMSDGEMRLIYDELVYIWQSVDFGTGAVPTAIAAIVLSSASQILQIFTAILLASAVVRRYKAFAAVGMYFAVNLAVNMIHSVFGFSTGFISSADGPMMQIGSAFTLMMTSQAALSAVIGVICWIVSVWLMKNKVNLE